MKIEPLPADLAATLRRMSGEDRDGPSAAIAPELGAMPLVGTGSMVGRPLLHILLSEGKVKGWTEDREWAERWANQYYRRSFVISVQELRPSNIGNEPRR